LEQFLMEQIALKSVLLPLLASVEDNFAHKMFEGLEQFSAQMFLFSESQVKDTQNLQEFLSLKISVTQNFLNFAEQLKLELPEKSLKFVGKKQAEIVLAASGKIVRQLKISHQVIELSSAVSYHQILQKIGVDIAVYFGLNNCFDKQQSNLSDFGNFKMFDDFFKEIYFFNEFYFATEKKILEQYGDQLQEMLMFELITFKEEMLKIITEQVVFLQTNRCDWVAEKNKFRTMFANSIFCMELRLWSETAARVDFFKHLLENKTFLADRKTKMKNLSILFQNMCFDEKFDDNSFVSLLFERTKVNCERI
jgi:hypothetical protein